jgi:hypothetical protein
MSVRALTLLCAKCEGVRKVDLTVLRDVPLWVRMIEEACRATGAGAVRVDGCDSCCAPWAIQDSTRVLAKLKNSVEGGGKDS